MEEKGRGQRETRAVFTLGHGLGSGTGTAWAHMFTLYFADSNFSGPGSRLIKSAF